MQWLLHYCTKVQYTKISMNSSCNICWRTIWGGSIWVSFWQIKKKVIKTCNTTKKLTTFSNRLLVGSRGSWESDNNFLSFYLGRHMSGSIYTLYFGRMFLLCRTFLLTFTMWCLSYMVPLSLWITSNAILSTFLLKLECIFKWPLYWRGLL